MRSPIVLLATLPFLLAACSSATQDVSDAASDPGSASASASPSASPSATPAPACPVTGTGDPAREVDPPSGEKATGDVSATLVLSQGDVPIDFDTSLAPCTVANFTSLATQGYFDNTRCHRLTTVGIFVLQCGDPTASGSGGPGYQFPDELKGLAKELQCTGRDSARACLYPAGTVAMANGGPDTNGSQFFLVYDDSPLPPAYTVFGTMTKAGLKTVQGVAQAGTAPGADPRDGPPKQDVTINEVTGLS